MSNLANQWALKGGHLQKQKWLIDSYITNLPPKDRWQLKQQQQQQQQMWT